MYDTGSGGMDYTSMDGHMKMKQRNMNCSAPLHSVDCHAPCLLPCLFPVWNCARGRHTFACNQKPLLFYAGRRIIPQVPTHCDIPHDVTIELAKDLPLWLAGYEPGQQVCIGQGRIRKDNESVLMCWRFATYLPGTNLPFLALCLGFRLKVTG